MKKEVFDNNPILKLSFDFVVMVIHYRELLNQNKKFVMTKQLLRSGSSIGANAMEAQNAESETDFIHKMKIAAKEAEERQYGHWLCDYAPNYPECKTLINKLEDINKVLGKILTTAKRKTPFSYFFSFFIF